MMRRPHLMHNSDEFVDLLIALLSQPADKPDQAIKLDAVAELHRLALALGKPVERQQTHLVMQAVETQLEQLRVGTTWYLLSGEGFARMLTTARKWPLTIAPAIVTTVGNAYHRERRPDVALSLSRHFNYEPSLWPQFEREARELELTPSKVSSTCYLI